MYENLIHLNNYHNIIFDLDNTVYDQRDFDFEVYTQLFNSPVLANNLLTYKQKMPYGYTKLFNDFLDKENIDKSVKECIDFYRSYEPKLDNCPSLLPLISSLKNSNIYLISNGYKKLQLNKIKALKLLNSFKKIIILDPSETIHLKPDSKAFVQLNISTENSIYIGDNLEIDKQFAINANIEFYHFQFKNKIWDEGKK